MNILITGGAGFIGSNLTKHFLETGHKVTVFDNLSRKGTEKNIEWLNKNHKKGLRFVEGDIRKFEQILPVAKDMDAVFHCCAQTAVTTSLTDPRKDFEINILGTFNLLEAVRKTNSDSTVFFCSTNKVYGNNVNLIPLIENETRYDFSDPKFANGIPENFPADASEHTPYGCSKYSGDIYVRDYSAVFGIKTVTFRLSCTYGYRQFGNEDQGYLAHFVISNTFGKPITIYGDGKQVRDNLFISDLVNLFDLSIKNIDKVKGWVFNVGGGPKNTSSLLEIIRMIQEISGRKSKITFDKWRPFDQKVYISDVSKIKEKTDWEPKVSVKDGVRNLVEWVNANKNLFAG